MFNCFLANFSFSGFLWVNVKVCDHLIHLPKQPAWVSVGECRRLCSERNPRIVILQDELNYCVHPLHQAIACLINWLDSHDGLSENQIHPIVAQCNACNYQKCSSSICRLLARSRDALQPISKQQRNTSIASFKSLGEFSSGCLIKHIISVKQLGAISSCQ